jgi:hypothetical protein
MILKIFKNTWYNNIYILLLLFQVLISEFQKFHINIIVPTGIEWYPRISGRNLYIYIYRIQQKQYWYNPINPKIPVYPLSRFARHTHSLYVNPELFRCEDSVIRFGFTIKLLLLFLVLII